MSRRLTALLAAPALAAVLASGCADEAAAARVGDTTISNDDLMTQAEGIADNENLVQAFQLTEEGIAGQADADRSFSQRYVGSLLSSRIQDLLLEQALAERDLPITEEALEKAEDRLPSELAAIDLEADDLPESLREVLIRQLAMSDLIKKAFGDEDNPQQAYEGALFEQAANTDVEISSKYGTWDKFQVVVIPPAGPAGADDAEAQP